MTSAERKQAAYALHRSAWRQNYLTHDTASWEQVARTFQTQSQHFANLGEMGLASEAQKHAATFQAIADQRRIEFAERRYATLAR